MTLALLLATLLLSDAATDARAEAERLARAGSHAEALERFQALVSTNPDDVDARVWIGRLHLWMGRPERAEPVFRSILTTVPDNLESLLALGTLLVGRGRYTEAAGVLNRAEELAPDDSAVLAAQGWRHRLAGRTSLALAYYRRAALLNPGDPAIRLAWEETQRLHAHRLEIGSFYESYDSLSLPNRQAGDVTLNLRVDDRFRVVARAQHQSGGGPGETRGGGGIQWRLSPAVTFRTEAVAGGSSQVLPRADALAEAAYQRGRIEITGGARFVRFATADVWIASPGITFWISDGLAISGRYDRSLTEFAGAATRIGHDSGAVHARLRLAPRLWAQTGYARGNESFDTLTPDRIGRFGADTVWGGVQLHLPTLTTLGVNCEFQRRENGGDMVRVSGGLVQRF